MVEELPLHNEKIAWKLQLYNALAENGVSYTLEDKSKLLTRVITDKKYLLVLTNLMSNPKHGLTIGADFIALFADQGELDPYQWRYDVISEKLESVLREKKRNLSINIYPHTPFIDTYFLILYYLSKLDTTFDLIRLEEKQAIEINKTMEEWNLKKSKTSKYFPVMISLPYAIIA